MFTVAITDYSCRAETNRQYLRHTVIAKEDKCKARKLKDSLLYNNISTEI